MTKDDDTAALISEARERSRVLRVNGATIAADTIDRLAAALERATADAARMRSALEEALSEAQAAVERRSWNPVRASIFAMRAALEPRP